MSTESNCPYCNHPLEAARLDERGGRKTCPRCGEPLPEAALRQVLQSTGIVAGAPPHGTTGAVGPDRDVAWPAKPVEANRRLARIILAGMAVVASVALVFALATQSLRRERDPRPMPTPPPSPVLAPGDLTALRFLPADTTLAAGVNVAGMLRDPAASPLLGKQGPAWLAWTLDLIKTRTGLARESIDHIVVGATLKNGLPTVTFAVETAKPYDLAPIKEALKKPSSLHLGQPLFRFDVKPMGEAYLWCKAERTLILVWRLDSVREEDLDAIPARPASGVAATPAAVRDFVSKRLEKQSLLWVVGNMEQWKPALAALAIIKNAPRLEEPWLSLRFASLSLVNEKDLAAPALTLRGQFEASDEKSARQVEAALRGVELTGQISASVSGPPEGAATDFWVLWQTRLNVEKAADAVRQAAGYLGPR